jgi:hypothetical protein
MINKAEALAALREELHKWRGRSYEELVALIGGETYSLAALGQSGARYQITVQIFWDAKPEGNVRVFGCVDDGGWRAFLPLSDSFIVASDGRFVGE